MKTHCWAGPPQEAPCLQLGPLPSLEETIPCNWWVISWTLEKGGGGGGVGGCVTQVPDVGGGRGAWMDGHWGGVLGEGRWLWRATPHQPVL